MTQNSNLFEHEIIDRLKELEDKLQKIFWFIEFHLGEVPLKCRKIFTEKGEYPYFKTKTDFKATQKMPIFGLGPSFGCHEFEAPEDPKEYREAAERMRAYAQEKDKIEETYYILSEFEEKSGDWQKKGETISEQEADRWVEAGPYEEIQTDSGETIRHSLRYARQRTKRVLPKSTHVPDLNEDKYFGNNKVWANLMERKRLDPNCTEAWEQPKQDSSAASATSSEPQDSPQACTSGESSPSSQESPDQ